VCVVFNPRYFKRKPDDGPVPKHVVFLIIVITTFIDIVVFDYIFPAISSLHTRRRCLISKFENGFRAPVWLHRPDYCPLIGHNRGSLLVFLLDMTP
jgi:hypothetical protein